YRIVAELMSDQHRTSNDPYMDEIDPNPVRNKEYFEVVDEAMWLKLVKEKCLGEKYNNITELIRDLRLMLENAYKFYGPAHSICKKGLRLEFIMEQKITNLPKNIVEHAQLIKSTINSILELTEGRGAKMPKLDLAGDNYFSHVMYRVRAFRLNREKELKLKRLNAMRDARRAKDREAYTWEDKLLIEPNLTHMKAMWEIPQIGHFIYLTLKTLNIYEVPQYELERALLMPAASKTLSMLLTSLLSSPQQRQKLGEKPPMPYRIWARKLAHKTLLWFRCYSRENRNPAKVFDLMGIEPQFWRICGPTNPFENLLFHEMTFHQRVWLIKSLCDFLLHNHKTVQEVMGEQAEADQRECILGEDRLGNQYLHFPQFCGQILASFFTQESSPESESSHEEEEQRDEDYIAEEKKSSRRSTPSRRGKKKKRKRRRIIESDEDEE
ncbi:unnamed protein product, partial [Meganyctiphanes norvegica]